MNKAQIRSMWHPVSLLVSPHIIALISRHQIHRDAHFLLAAPVEHIMGIRPPSFLMPDDLCVLTICVCVASFSAA